MDKVESYSTLAFAGQPFDQEAAAQIDRSAVAWGTLFLTVAQGTVLCAVHDTVA